jgi:hypothetical protein
MHRNIVIATVIWGEAYVDDYLNFGIPSILSNSLNHEKDKVIFKIITSAQSLKYIKSNVQKYAWFCECTFEFVISNAITRLDQIERITGLKLDKYPIHSHGFNLAIQKLEDKDILIFNYGDFIWGDQSINKILNLLEDSGKDILTCHPLTCDDQDIKIIDKCRQSNGKLKIPSDELMKTSLNSAKWWYDQYRWGNSKSSDYLSILYWKISEEQYLFRGFHVHPIAFRKLSKRGATLPPINFGTLDGHYLSALTAQGWTSHFTSNTEELCVGTLTNKSKSYYFKTEKNFSNRFVNHVIQNHNIHEIDNLKNFLFIGDIPEDKEKYIQISTENLKNTLTRIDINKDFKDKKRLITDLKFIEQLEDIKTMPYFKIIIQFIILRDILRLFLVILFRTSMYIGRIYFVTGQKFLFLKSRIQISKLYLIQSLQKQLKYDFWIEEIKLNKMVNELKLSLRKRLLQVNQNDINKKFSRKNKSQHHSRETKPKEPSVFRYLCKVTIVAELSSHVLKKSNLYN